MLQTPCLHTRVRISVYDPKTQRQTHCPSRGLCESDKYLNCSAFTQGMDPEFLELGGTDL